MQFTMYAVMILISWIGAKAIVASGNNVSLGLTTGQLTALITYAMQILTSLMMLSMVFAMISIASSSATRCAEILEEKPSITSPANPTKEVKDGSIVFKDVSFTYSDKAEKNVLSNINLNIPSGSSLGIIGATGSSKSSLVQLIPRLYDASKGEVFAGGENVKAYDLDILRNSVSMVLQKNELFSGTIKKIFFGEMKKQQMRKLRKPAMLPVLMNSLILYLMAITPILNKAGLMFQAVRSKDFVLREPC